MTTSTADTGKRLSDAELAEIAKRNERDTSLSSRRDLTSHDEFCTKDRAALLSHTAALTTNRGSVERSKEIIEQKAAEYKIGALFAANPILSIAMNAAIQQAVSECSGGGAEEMREACVAYHIKQELLWDESDDEKAEEMARYHQQSAFALQNLPLPPSPVKESRDAVIEECANRVLEVSQAISSGFVEKHCPYCEEGRIGASNTGFYAANSIRLLKSTS